MNIDDLKNMTGQQIVAEIERHNRLYWGENTPEISDEDYDMLLQRLEELSPGHPLLDNVGTPEVASLGKVRLDDPMISLDKTYFFKDAPKGKKSLMKWVEENSRTPNEEFLIQPKYDGISANYSNGILATRGQGTEDENVSDKIPLIELETHGCKGPLDRNARGEILIRTDDFKTLYSKIIKNGGGTYKNPRNAVGGILGLKDIREIRMQGAKLTLVDYSLHSWTVKSSDFESEWPAIVEKIEQLPYPMDGIVIKLADEAYSRSLGFTAHHPRGQIAFKFSGMRKKTVLLDVVWSFGKKCLTPVGRVEPVEIGGVTITNVTMHNAAMVEDNDWQAGDTVIIERAGDVIPHIVGSEPGTARRPIMITNCPCCRTRLTRDSKELVCPNPECFETNLQKILASVKNIGIEELGEPNIRKMMQTLGVKKLKDILNLEIDDILKLDGFKQKSAANLHSSIQKAKNTTDYQLLASLNIHGIGQTVAEKLLRDYTLEELRRMDADRLSAIPETGTETSEKLFTELKEQSDTLDELISVLDIAYSKKDPKPKPLVCFEMSPDKLEKPLKHYEELAKAHGYNRVKPVKNTGGIYLPGDLKTLITTKRQDSSGELIALCRSKGIEILTPEKWEASLPAVSEKIISEKTICFTGKMPEARSYYETLARKNGFVPVDSVTSSLTLLVADDVNSRSSKCDKARKSGIKIVQLDEWLKENEEKPGTHVKEDDGTLPGLLN